MILWDIVLIQFLCVCIVDVTGAIEDMLTPFVRWITRSKVGHLGKPLNCSVCLTWWCSIIWLLIMGAFTLPNIAFSMAMAVLTPITYLLICTVKDVATAFIEMIYRFLGI